MQGAGDALLSFADPPVTEVVVGVSFRPLTSLTAPHLGLLWRSRLEETFPKVEEHPPYDLPVERFDSPPQGSGFSLRLGQSLPSPRIWFLKEDGQELLQVQKDWFACNWRKVTPDAEYGRWPSRREAFQRWFSAFEAFIQEEKLGNISTIQCEVTYINHIFAAGVWGDHGDLPKVLLLASGKATEFLPKPEQIQLRGQYLIAGEDGGPVGRLHVDVIPAFRREDNAPIFVLNLTARGILEGEGLPGIMAFMDRGREWIVRGFSDLTSSAMQEAWGRNG